MNSYSTYPVDMTVFPDPSSDLLRLMAKIAHLYHERRLKQPEIASQLGLSQARVSRLLKQAEQVGIVRTTVHPPLGVFTDLEEQLEKKYGLREVVVVDTGSEEEAVIPFLGVSAAVYLQTALVGAHRIGISSWSETLLATVNAMRPVAQSSTQQVVQVLGGLGTPSSQAHATRLTERFAQLLDAQAVFLPVPGVVGSGEVREALMLDPNIQAVFDTFDNLSLVLLGIGSLDPSKLIRESGNVVSAADQESLRQAGAVGDVCQRFFDDQGRYTPVPLSGRILGISAEQLRRVPRRVGVAGGRSKFFAIRAAARGGWIDTLITDHHMAQQLIQN